MEPKGKRLYGEHPLTLYWVSEPRSLVMWVISRELLLQPASPMWSCAQSLFNGCKWGSLLLSLFYGWESTVRRSPEKAVKKRGSKGAWMWQMGDKKKKRGRERMIRIKIKILLRKLGGFCLGSLGLLVCKEAETEPTGLCVQGDRRWERSLGWPEKCGQRISQEAPCSLSQDAHQGAQRTISFCCHFLRWLKHGISEGQLC